MEAIRIVRRAPVCKHRFSVSTYPEFSEGWDAGYGGLCPACANNGNGEKRRYFVRKRRYFVRRGKKKPRNRRLLERI